MFTLLRCRYDEDAGAIFSLRAFIIYSLLLPYASAIDIFCRCRFVRDATPFDERHTADIADYFRADFR